jgi:hypothetical protein
MSGLMEQGAFDTPCWRALGRRLRFRFRLGSRQVGGLDPAGAAAGHHLVQPRVLTPVTFTREPPSRLPMRSSPVDGPERMLTSVVTQSRPHDGRDGGDRLGARVVESGLERGRLPRGAALVPAGPLLGP